MSDTPAAIVELAQLPHWVCWRYETRGEKQTTKVPLTISGTKASSTDPATWNTHARVMLARERGIGDGIGFVFTASDPYCGFDLDHCIGVDGLEPWAAEIVRELDSYTEISPSGRGLHGIVRATLPTGRRCTKAYGMYDRERYFTITGRRFEGARDTIEERTSAVSALHARLFAGGASAPKPTEYTRRSFAALPLRVERVLRSDRRVRARFDRSSIGLADGSPSAVDYALALQLARRGLHGDEIEAAIRWSRSVHGEREKHENYYPRTVGRALAQARVGRRA